MDYAEIYAVDFDRTLNLADTYPELGEPNAELIEFLKERRAAGDKIILWTCRKNAYTREMDIPEKRWYMTHGSARTVE